VYAFNSSRNNISDLVGLGRNGRPHLADQCINCSNGVTTSGLIIGDDDSPPTLLHCQCNPGTGAAQDSWPTAIFDISELITLITLHVLSVAFESGCVDTNVF